MGGVTEFFLGEKRSVSEVVGKEVDGEVEVFVMEPKEMSGRHLSGDFIAHSKDTKDVAEMLGEVKIHGSAGGKNKRGAVVQALGSRRWF